MFDLNEFQDRLRRNLFESVIPFWERHSLDHEFGGQIHCLARDGAPYDDRKYVWMQGRAVWMFCRLYNTVEKRPEWIGAARLILDFVLRHAIQPSGQCYFSVTRDGRPAFIQRKPYAGFFVALALAEFIKTGFAEDRHRELAQRLFRDVQAWIHDPTPLGRPALAGQKPVRQLADVYVLAFLAMEMMAVVPEAECRALIEQRLAEVREHWLPERRTLLENRPLDGSDYRASPDTRLLCPGSAIEVACTMWHAMEAIGRKDPALESWLLEVIEGSLELGWDREFGGLHYFVDAEDLPCLQLEASMKLWWPHTEALYGLVLAYTHTREQRWLDWLERVDRYTFETFVDWEHGEWFGYCDRRGIPANLMKGGPYKGFFHVPRCLLFSLQRLAL